MGSYRATICVACVLQNGEEVDEAEQPDTTKFTQQGTYAQMHRGLMLTRGRTIRLLRGASLKSNYAPEVGIRYDGLYVVKTWSMKMSTIDIVDTYKCDIRFERVKHQMPLNLSVPKPSQRDEWKLYEEMVGSDFRARKGDLEYSRWREFEDKQRAEKEA